MRGGKKTQKENILLYVGQINLVRHLIVEGPGGTSDGEVIEWEINARSMAKSFC